jgi:uncharacterized membrane protein
MYYNLTSVNLNNFIIMKILKRCCLVLMIVLFITAGINHFIHPEVYYSIIPPYLPFPRFINMASGASEIILGVLLIFLTTRKAAANGIVILLALFIPAHIYMIQKGGYMSETMCVPEWVAWVRLFPVQLMLMGWAWWIKK